MTYLDFPVLKLAQARALPSDVESSLEEIAQAAEEAAFEVIAERLRALGYEPGGDISPGEAFSVSDVFEAMVRFLALNDQTIYALNEEED